MQHTEKTRLQTKDIFHILQSEEWKKCCLSENPLQQLNHSIDFFQAYLKPTSLNYIIYEPISERFGLSPINKSEFIELIKNHSGEKKYIVEELSENHQDLLAFGMAIIQLTEHLLCMRESFEKKDFERIGEFIILSDLPNPWIEINKNEVKSISELSFQNLLNRLERIAENKNSWGECIEKEIKLFSSILFEKEFYPKHEDSQPLFMFEEATIENIKIFIEKNTEKLSKEQLYTFNKRTLEAYACIQSIQHYLACLEERKKEMNKEEEKSLEEKEEVKNLFEKRIAILQQSSEENSKPSSMSAFPEEAFGYVDNPNTLDEEDVLNWMKSGF